MAHKLDLYLISNDCAQFCQHVFRRIARQQASIHLQDNLAGNDIDLTSAPDDRDVNGVMENGIYNLSRRLDDVDRQTVLIQLLQEIPQFGRGPIVHGQRGVPAGTAQRRLHPTYLFFEHLNGIELLAADRDAKTTELSKSIAYVFEELRVVLDQELCALFAARLFVA